MKLILATVIAALATVTLGGPAQAIVGGQPDGDNHPNVGAVIAYGPGREYLGHCSGTLVSPTVVVSAAHCFDPATWFPDVVELYCVNFNKDLLAQRCPLNGTAHNDPRWYEPTRHPNGTAGFMDQTDFDLGVVVLDRPASDVYPGITPAPIIAKDGLEQFRTGTRNRYFTEVGYGLQRLDQAPAKQGFFIDFTRNTTTAPLNRLTAAVLRLAANPKDNRGGGGICSGDSGGPTLLGDVIVGVHSWASRDCTSLSGSVRLDTESARGFLGQFVPLP